jgi:hypothetical protein
VKLGLSSSLETGIGDNLSNIHHRIYGRRAEVLGEGDKLVALGRQLENSIKPDAMEDGQHEPTVMNIYPGPWGRGGGMAMRGCRNLVFSLVFFREKVTGWIVD